MIIIKTVNTNVEEINYKQITEFKSVIDEWYMYTGCTEFISIHPYIYINHNKPSTSYKLNTNKYLRLPKWNHTLIKFYYYNCH